MNKIILIIDASQAFLHSEINKILDNWGVKKNNLKTITEWKFTNNTTSLTLFGEKQLTHLNLEDKKDLSKFVELITKDKEKRFSGKWFGEGVIITATTAQGISKVEKLVNNSNGTVQKKRKPQEVKKELLDRIHISKEVKSLIDPHVGEDYEMLISFVNEVSKLSKEKQKEITIEEVVSMLPRKPGAMMPWDFTTAALNGNTSTALKLIDRILIDSHVLVLMAILKKKIDVLYKVKVLMKDKIFDSKIQSEILNMKNGPNFWEANKIAKTLDYETIRFIYLLFDKTESDIKGGSAIDNHDLFKSMIVKMTLAIKFNKPLE